MKTKLGWTLSVKIRVIEQKGPSMNHTILATVVTSVFSKEATITDLWTLDTLGILWSIRETFKSSNGSCYTAFCGFCLSNWWWTLQSSPSMDWENHLPLPNNYNTAFKRLNIIIKKLKAEGYYEAYQRLLDEWQYEQVIEEVPSRELDLPSHYLPHHHIIKTSSTTPIWRVFDASSRENLNPSLNQCLERRPNFIENIPSVLAQFCLEKIAVVVDIRRAFLQIWVYPKDRNFLRFLWIDWNGILKTYPHCRVVFGVSPSPFLLEFCINIWTIFLTQCKEGTLNWPIEFIKLLAKSFYVDNALTRV